MFNSQHHLMALLARKVCRMFFFSPFHLVDCLIKFITISYLVFAHKFVSLTTHTTLAVLSAVVGFIPFSLFLSFLSQFKISNAFIHSSISFVVVSSSSYRCRCHLKMYVGQHSDPRCIYVPPSSGKTFYAFRIAYARCGTKPDLNGQFYENTVCIEYSDNTHRNAYT